MIKPFVEVKLILHGGSEVTIADYVNDVTGEYIPDGTEAAAMLDRHQAIHYVDRGVDPPIEEIYPYHAIVMSTVTKTPAEYEKPEDSYCQPVDSPFAPTGGSRTITLPNNGGQTTPSDERLLFEKIIPFMLGDEIEVKFMGEKVTAINHTTESDNQIYTITTENGSHELYTSVSGDYDYFYPTVDGETVNLVSVTVGTKKYYAEVYNYNTSVASGLYDAGARINCEGYEFYSKQAFNGGGEAIAFGTDHRLPAITEDIMYEVH